jgi:hypothetical protein
VRLTVTYHGNVYEDITAVLYSLIVLLSVELNPDSTISPSVNNQERISDVGLRFAFKR